MEHRRLGALGLKVSELGLGSSMFTFVCQHDNLFSVRECVRTAWEGGISLFDTAERYGLGLAEVVLGEVLRGLPRDEIVVTTKLLVGGVKPTQRGLSRKHILEGLDNSLRRLQMSYVDLLYCHRYDEETEIEEVVRAMDSAVRSGKALYWGTSEWTPAQISAARSTARELDCIPPTVEQTEYNLFVRERVEVEYAPFYGKGGLGLLTYGPLAGGVLTGKHNEKVAEKSRVMRGEELAQEYLREERLAGARAFAKVAEELECSPAQLALAWCLKNEHVSCVLVGVTGKEQLVENMGALEVKERLMPDVMDRIEEVATAPQRSAAAAGA